MHSRSTATSCQRQMNGKAVLRQGLCGVPARCPAQPMQIFPKVGDPESLALTVLEDTAANMARRSRAGLANASCPEGGTNVTPPGWNHRCSHKYLAVRGLVTLYPTLSSHRMY